MGQNVECTWYMDDYGKKESTELTMKTGGVAGVENIYEPLRMGVQRSI